jgi:hypothetical protein
MAFAFSWETTPLAWPARLGAWDWRSENYRTPVPCKNGSNCLFTGVCSFVHPGEEGTGLKYFPGRSYVGEDGTECWESAVVRLIGSEQARVRYYERRRLRLSWAAWCARVGLPAPQRPAPSGRRRERLCLADPATSGERLDLAPAPSAAEMEIVGEDEFVATAADQAAAEARQAFFQRQQAMAAAWQQQQLFLYQQQMAAYAARPRSVLEQKNELGEHLYPLVKDALERSAADRAAIGYSGPTFTAGKITGMLLEAHTVEELQQILVDDALFSPLMMEACEVLFAALPAPAPPAAERAVTTVEVRPAAQVKSVTGVPVMAACVDDSLKDLLEDIRREDAGLPPLARPPTITSYEPQADGSVRIVKTVLPMPKEEESWGDAADRMVRLPTARPPLPPRQQDLRRQAMKNAQARGGR